MYHRDSDSICNISNRYGRSRRDKVYPVMSSFTVSSLVLLSSDHVQFLFIIIDS